MNLLLDTQALLWFVLDDSRLSEKARQSIVTPVPFPFCHIEKDEGARPLSNLMTLAREVRGTAVAIPPFPAKFAMITWGD